MKNSFLLKLILSFLFFSSKLFCQFTTTSPGGTSNLFANAIIQIGSSTPAYINPLGYFQSSRLGYFGTYDSSQVQGIWSVSPTFQINTTLNTFGNYYGLGYAYHTTGGAPFANTHQIVFTNAGIIGASIGLDGKAYFKTNLGINVVNPLEKLHVNGNTLNTGYHTVLNSSTTNQFRIDPMDAVGPKLKLGTVQNPTAYFEMGAYNNINNIDNKSRDIKIFNTNNPSAFIIKANGGFIGIGTETPVSQFSNTSSYIQGISTTNAINGGFTWITPGTGFSGSFYNSASGGNGLQVKINGLNSSQTAFEVTSGLVNTVASTYFRILGNGNIGIGNQNPQNKLELTHGTAGNSGLRFTNLNSSSTTVSNTINKSLTLNATGDVILSNTVNSVAHNLVGNMLTTTINGVLSNAVALPTNTSPSINIYNSNGTLTNERLVNLDNKRLQFFSTNGLSYNFNPNAIFTGNESLCEIYNGSSQFFNPNLRAEGIFSIGNGISRNQFSLTYGINKEGAWIQSMERLVNTVYKYHINPLGGNVGIGVLDATAQLHTKNSVRFENLNNPTPPPVNLLGTDEDGNVFEYDPSQFGGASQDSWLLAGNANTIPGTQTGQNFLGTTDAQDLVFGVNSNEKLRIKPSGRIQFFGWAPSSGANSAYNMFIGGGNDNPVTASSNISNIAIGVGSMINNTTGIYNTTLGFSALENNSSGASNTAIGFQSLRMNTTGHSNVSMGANALFHNASGEYNVSMGVYSLLNNTTGNGNVGIGAGVLKESTNGNTNTAVGIDALRETNGTSNVAFGVGSLSNLGSSSIGDGFANIALGSFAGKDLTKGDGNIFIGYDVQGPISNTDSNQLNIGNWIFGKNGQIAIGSFTNLPLAFITNNDYQLIVKKGIRTEKIRVDIASVKNWADYVFAKDYTLLPLNELEKFIKTNGHLPNVPKAEQVVKEGIDVADMNVKLLEKIEELTLHTIELNKKNETQQKLIDSLLQRVEKLEKNTKQ